MKTEIKRLLILIAIIILHIKGWLRFFNLKKRVHVKTIFIFVTF